MPKRRRNHRRQKLLREGRTRPLTIPVKKMTQEQMRVGRLIYPLFENEPMPRTRAECHEVPRPCPFVRCKYNLYLDVDPRTGSLKLNHPDKEPGELEESCALDIAERGGMTLEEVGIAINTTRERVRQIESAANERLQKRPETEKLREHIRETVSEKDCALSRPSVGSRFKG